MALPVPPTSREPYANASAAIRQCEELLKAPNRERAREVGRALEAQYPGSARVLVAVARLYLETSLVAEAKQALQAALRALGPAHYDPTPEIEVHETAAGSLPHYSLPDIEELGNTPYTEEDEPTGAYDAAPTRPLPTSAPPPPPVRGGASGVTIDDFDEEEEKTVVYLAKPDDPDDASLPRFSLPGSVPENEFPRTGAAGIGRAAAAFAAGGVARLKLAWKKLAERQHPPGERSTGERPSGERRFGLALPSFRKSYLKLGVVAGVTLLLVIVTSYGYLRGKQRHDAARQELGDAERLLSSLDVEDLRTAGTKLEASFALDGMQESVGWLLGGSDGWGFSSLEPHAAALRARRHVLLLMLDPATTVDAAAALEKAQKAGADPEALAAVEVFLAGRSDPAEVRKLLQRWDTQREQDALYQVAAGIALDRLGDARALDRFDAARKLDPRFLLPEVLYAQTALFTKDPSEAEPEVTRLKERARTEPVLVPMARALAALSWAVREDRGPVPSEQVALRQEDRQLLPPALSPARATVDLVTTLLDREEDAKAKAARAARIVQSAETPAIGVCLARIAFDEADDETARLALERTRELAERFVPAAILQAELHLLAGRFDAAAKAIEGAGSAVETNAVHAVTAYERLDVKELERKLAGLDSARFTALRLAQKVLTGALIPGDDEIESLARSKALWGPLVAVDSALDSGRVDLAERLVRDWPSADARPVLELRLARLKRYQGRAFEAAKLASSAAKRLPESDRARTEHLFALAAAGKADEGLTLLEEKPLPREPVSGWMEGFLVGMKSGWIAANVKIGFLRLPENDVALPWRMGVARALAIAGDPRAYGYLKNLDTTVPKHPDLVTAHGEL